MDFSVIFQLRTKKFWWMDVIFYFVMSLLIATVLCYLIFLTKNNFQREDIKKEDAALQTVGTEQQKEYEREVISYQKKISDFANLLKNHEFASNVFVFMEAQTMPNIWFKQFNLDERNNGVQLSGESDDMDAFSRQVATFEKNQYVKSVAALNSSLGGTARLGFNINLTLDQSIFGYIYNTSSISQANASSGQLPVQQGQTAPASGQQALQTPSSEKLIASFHLLLTPEVAGVLDQTKYTIALTVPYGTDVKNLTSSIVISPGATVSPASNVSQDFTSPIIYTVTAQDGSTQDYTVRAIVAAPLATSEKPSQSGFITLIIVIVAGIIIAAAVVIFFFLRKKREQQIT
jgi:flagellar basal body-associated protein FliL